MGFYNSSPRAYDPKFDAPESMGFEVEPTPQLNERLPPRFINNEAIGYFRLSPAGLHLGMETNVPEKVMAVLDQVDSEGSARTTRLTVLKKWFEEPGRLRAFGLWIARRTAGRKGKAKGEAGELLNEARKLVGKASTYEDMVRPIDLAAAKEFYGRAKGFQNTYRRIPFGITRVIRCWPLYLVESGLRLYLGYSSEPTDGYQLAAEWAQNYDPRYGTNLNGPSKGKLRELVRFMFTIEAHEDTGGYQEAQARLARLAPAFPKPKRGLWGWFKMEKNLSPV